MAKSKKKKSSSSAKFRFTLNRTFLALVALLLFATVGSLVVGLKSSYAATNSYTYTVANGTYRICLKWTVAAAPWKAQMAASSSTSNSNSAVNIQQGGTSVPNPSTKTVCSGNVRVQNKKINVTYKTRNISGLDGQCRDSSGKDRCGSSNRQ